MTARREEAAVELLHVHDRQPSNQRRRLSNERMVRLVAWHRYATINSQTLRACRVSSCVHQACQVIQQTSFARLVPAVGPSLCTHRRTQ